MEEMNPQEVKKKVFGAGNAEGTVGDLIEADVRDIITGEQVGTMFLKRAKMPVITRFREIRNGDGRRKGNEIKANEYLFTQVFDHFEFKIRDGKGGWTELSYELDLGSHKTELAFWLSCQKLIDALLIKYHGENFPDTDFRKSGSGDQDDS